MLGEFMVAELQQLSSVLLSMTAKLARPDAVKEMPKWEPWPSLTSTPTHPYLSLIPPPPY